MASDAFDPRYRSLDHWRGAAALAVLFFHGFGSVRATGSTLHPSIAWLKSISDFGGFGVDLFFVISGYCIAANVWRASSSGSGPWSFLRDRLFRIFPVYWFACVAAIVMNALAAPYNHVPLSKNLPPDAIGWIGNLLLIQPYVGASPLLLVSWSLVFEVGFYILVALAFFLFRLGARLNWVIALSILVGFVGLWEAGRGFFYFLEFWPEFVCGGLVFLVLWQKSNRSEAVWISLAALIGFAIVGSSLQSTQRAGQMTCAIIFALFLILLHPVDSRIVSFRPLRWLGAVGVMSYSLYLIHVPLGLRPINLGARWFSLDGPGMWVLQLAGWANSILFAALFYKFCEAPVEHWRKARHRRSTVVASVSQIDNPQVQSGG